MSISALSVGSLLSSSMFENSSNVTNDNEIVSAATTTNSSTDDELEIVSTENIPAVTFTKVYDTRTDNSTNKEHIGLISYLTITFRSGASDFKIKRAIGSLTYNLSTDESYAEDQDGAEIINGGQEITDSVGIPYKFTRQATYIVSYRKGEIEHTAQCYFSPEINEDVLQGKIATRKLDNIHYIDGKYYMIGNGRKSISQFICFNTELYNLRINNRENFETAQSNYFVINIPVNCYGKLLLTFSSKKGFLTRTIEIIVINPQYEFTFDLYDKDGNKTTNNFNNYAFGKRVKDEIKDGSGDDVYVDDYYVFNSKVTLNLSISDDLYNTDGIKYNLSSESALNKAKLDCVNHLNLYSTETVMSTNNDPNKTSLKNRVLADAPEDPIWSVDFDAVDHSTFKISTALSFSDKTIVDTSILNFKIITKLPRSIQNKYDFGIFLTNDKTNEGLNYINTCYDGYLFDETTIHTQSADTALQVVDSSLKYYYTINGVGTTMGSNTNIQLIELSAKNIVNYDVRIQTTQSKITNDNDFKNYYTFNFNVRYYGTSVDSFIFQLFESKYTDKLQNNSTIKNLTSCPEIKVPENYTNSCIPVYMQVTYNEKVYEDFYRLQAGDFLTFTDYGDYVLEFYTFPTYEYCDNFLNYWTDQITLYKYYSRFEFTIDGPSITVTSTANDGSHLVVTNNMYSRNTAYIDVTIREELNETFEIYKNNELVYSNNVSEADLSTSAFGTWKVCVLDANKNIIKSTTFIIADSSYQGLSINHHPDYEELVVYKLDTETNGYKPLDSALSYHITDAGAYRIKVTNGEKIYFNVKNRTGAINTLSASKTITNYIDFSIVDPYFSITFETGSPGESITEKVSVVGVNGVDIRTVQVYRNGKFVSEFTPSDMSGFANILGSSTSFSDTGVYTFRLIVKFGNEYDVQIEKFYKANIALILLIIIGAFGIAFLIYFIFRSKRGLKVK